MRRAFKKSIVLEPTSRLAGEYAAMTKCDGVFVSLSTTASGRLVVRDVDRKVLFTLATKLNFKTFFVYADMVPGPRFFAYDTSLETDFRRRHAALAAAVGDRDAESVVVVVWPAFTRSPIRDLGLAPPVVDAPTDGVVLVSVADVTPHYKWKPVQTADFVVTAEKTCLAGWLTSKPLPYDWCRVSSHASSTYAGVPFGDERGPHRFQGDAAPGTVVECRFQQPDTWVQVRTRDDKTRQYSASALVFAGANSWTTARSVLTALIKNV